MGSSFKNGIFCHKFASIYFLILVISTSSHLSLFNAEAGRRLTQTETAAEEEKTILRAQIGSRPPRCDRMRCSSCGPGPCEAIQVPTNPQIRRRRRRRKEIRNSSSTAFSVNYYARGSNRGDDNSNYKPMSWKCKCGNFIFNP